MFPDWNKGLQNILISLNLSNHTAEERERDNNKSNRNNLTRSNGTEANTTGAIFKDIYKDAISTVEEEPINEELQIMDAENDIPRKDNNCNLTSGAPIRYDPSKISSYEQHFSDSYQDKKKQMNVDTSPLPLEKDNKFIKNDSTISKVVSYGS